MREHTDGVHLKGIGGPGAPHVFELKRISELGLQHANVNCEFWDRRHVPYGQDDVVLRTLFFV